jgi:hypothetical protein
MTEIQKRRRPQDSSTRVAQVLDPDTAQRIVGTIAGINP